MSSWLKEKIEGTLFSLCKRMVAFPSSFIRKIFEPIQTNLILSKFKRSHALPPSIKTDDKSYSNEVKRYWKAKLGVNINPVWHHILASYTDVTTPKYITEEIWSKYIHNSLNFPPYHDPLIADKNILDLYIGNEHLPRTVLKRIDGYYYDEKNKSIGPNKAKEYLLQSDATMFVKPSRLYKGINAIKIHTRDGRIIQGDRDLSFDQLTRKAGDNFIVQYVVEQHPKIAEVHPSSLNTIRLFTLKLGTEVHYLNGSLKFGADNNVADNTGNGILCSIEKENYTLSDLGFNRKLNTFKKHPSTGYKLSSFGEIPNYQSAINLCLDIHKEKLFHKLAAWDVAITKDGSPLIIELNSKVSMFMWQIRFQGPFFGGLTEEVLRYVKQKRGM